MFTSTINLYDIVIHQLRQKCPIICVLFLHFLEAQNKHFSCYMYDTVLRGFEAQAVTHSVSLLQILKQLGPGKDSLLQDTFCLAINNESRCHERCL